jgi:UDP-2,4-diacetamido-2,4,6-trideoxy-beta-L-altropyranose hydrolase
MNPGTLLIRADASVAVGTGHVMRCLALAQAWQDAGGCATFAMAESTPAIKDRLGNEGVRLVEIEGSPGGGAELEQTIALARNCGATWVVADGYEFDAGYQRALKDAGLKVLLLDDNGRGGSYAADVVVNQNIHAHENLYKDRTPHTKLVLGTKYALLRREFASLHGEQREIPSVARSILVALGGSDPDNVTLRVLQAMDQVVVPDLQISVVVGGSNPHLAAIAESAAKARHRCSILENVANMGEVIVWADLAISAAGSVCWEYCALGLPAVVVAVAENQVSAAEALHASGAARLIPGGARFAVVEMAELITRLVNSIEERRSLSQVARTLVDGGGASRVVSILLSRGDGV